MADFDTVGILDVGGDGPITAAGRAQVRHFSKRSLFCLVLDQRAILADLPAERPIAAEILPGAPLMALGVADPFTDPLPLELGDRGENGQLERKIWSRAQVCGGVCILNSARAIHGVQFVERYCHS